MKVKLKDIVSDFIVPMRDKPTRFDGDVPWCRIEDFEGKYLFDSKSEQRVSKEIINSMRLKVYPVGTLLFSCSATIGVTAITKRPLCTNQTFIGIVPSNKIDVEYLYYYLGLIGYRFKQAASVTTIPYLSRKFFEDLEVILPIDKTVQVKIAKVLSDLDSKIELNKRINAELESMAKTLYDYWFVQFDFPDENGKPYKTSGGKMVWNEALKREIPEGWEVDSIDSYAEVKKGELITAKDAKEGSIKVIAAGIDFSYLHSTPNRLKNTITISGSGANAGFINFWREPIFASDCITVRGKSDSETLILLQYLNFIQPHILNQATGSAQPHVYPSDIKVLNYVIPPNPLIENYGKVVLPMNEKIGTNIVENHKLTELRNWLLPMLMNGQVKVG